MVIFEMKLHRTPGKLLGLDVVVLRLLARDQGAFTHGRARGSSCLVVERVSDGGEVEVQNRRTQEPFRIRTGDIIEKVNGIEGTSSAAEVELRCAPEVTLQVSRAAVVAAAVRGRRQAASSTALRPPEAGPGPPGEFTFEALISRPGGLKLGIGVLPIVLSDSCGLSVQQISKGGAVDAWNRSSPEELRLCLGDCITGVNGAVGDISRMSAELRGLHAVRLTVRRGTSGRPLAPPAQRLGQPKVAAVGRPRQVRFEVVLLRAPGTLLGMDLVHLAGDGLDGLVVESVAGGGAMARWNQQSRHPDRVQAGDYIVDVNGVRLGVTAMVEELLRESPLVRFVVQRRGSGAAAAHGAGPAQPARPGAGRSNDAPMANAGGGATSLSALARSEVEAERDSCSSASASTAGFGGQVLGRPPARQEATGADTAGSPGADLAAAGLALAQAARQEAPEDDAASLLAALGGVVLPSSSDFLVSREEDTAFMSDGPCVDRSRANCAPVAPIGAGRAAFAAWTLWGGPGLEAAAHPDGCQDGARGLWPTASEGASSLGCGGSFGKAKGGEGPTRPWDLGTLRPWVE